MVKISNTYLFRKVQNAQIILYFLYFFYVQYIHEVS